MSEAADKKHCDPDSFAHPFTLCLATFVSKVPIAPERRDLEAFWCVKEQDLYFHTEGSERLDENGSYRIARQQMLQPRATGKQGGKNSKLYSCWVFQGFVVLLFLWLWVLPLMLKTHTSQCKPLKFTGYFPQHLPETATKERDGHLNNLDSIHLLHSRL